MSCTCYVDERYWTTHYGAVEPGSQMEPNPDCPVHFPCAACLMEYEGWGGPGCCEVCDGIRAEHTCALA